MPLNRRQALTGFAATATAAALGGSTTARASSRAHGDLFPSIIPLPDNWLPEGIAIGLLPFAYFGSRADGSIYRANLITGTGRVLPVPGPGTPAVGLKLDRQYDKGGRLFVAGGTGGDGRVVSALTGKILATFPFTTATSFVNDVVLTGDAAFFTDTANPALYVVPLGRHGSLPDPTRVRMLPLPAELVGLNGIAETPDRRALLAVQSGSGTLFRIDGSTGAATPVDLAGETLVNGDGLLLDGRTLYVVQNRLNTVAVVRLSRDGTSGRVLGRVSDPNFDVPTTVARFFDRLYLPNARFGAVPPATTFTAVAIPVPRR